MFKKEKAKITELKLHGVSEFFCGVYVEKLTFLNNNNKKN